MLTVTFSAKVVSLILNIIVQVVLLLDFTIISNALNNALKINMEMKLQEIANPAIQVANLVFIQQHKIALHVQLDFIFIL